MRQKRITTILPYLLALASVWVIGCMLQSRLCCQNTPITIDSLSESHPTRIKKISGDTEIINKPFAFLSAKGLEVSGTPNFIFSKNSFAPQKPFPIALDNDLSQITRYLNKYPNKQLIITGLYSDEEENPSVFPNLGYARANQINHYLTQLGAPRQQLRIES